MNIIDIIFIILTVFICIPLYIIEFIFIFDFFCIMFLEKKNKKYSSAGNFKYNLHILFEHIIQFSLKFFKLILISAVFRLIFFFLGAIMSFFNLPYIYFSLFLFILIGINFYFSRNKGEYILNFILIVTF